jgi:hypothetical protein
VNRAATRMLALFFATDHLTFSLTSGNADVVQKTRTYSRLSEQTPDVVNARIVRRHVFPHRRLGRAKTGMESSQLGLLPFPAACLRKR